MALPQPGQDAWCAPAHVRHKPEQTLLYQLVEQYWPEFQAQLSETGPFSATARNARVRGLPGVWSTGERFFARALRELQPRASGSLQL